jgi:hypothetical protein
MDIFNWNSFIYLQTNIAIIRIAIFFTNPSCGARTYLSGILPFYLQTNIVPPTL